MLVCTNIKWINIGENWTPPHCRLFTQRSFAQAQNNCLTLNSYTIMRRATSITTRPKYVYCRKETCIYRKLSMHTEKHVGAIVIWYLLSNICLFFLSRSHILILVSIGHVQRRHNSPSSFIVEILISDDASSFLWTTFQNYHCIQVNKTVFILQP